MTRKEIILSRIESMYGTIAEFSRTTGIPDSSIRNIKNREDEYIDGMSVGTFVKICKAIRLDAESLIDGAIEVRPNEKKERIWREYLEAKNGGLPSSLELIDHYSVMNENGRSVILGVAKSMVKSGDYSISPATETAAG